MNEPTRYGGGLANQMRTLGYRVEPPTDPAECSAWTMTPPGGGNQVWLAKDEAEGWEKADQHWHQTSVANAMSGVSRTPPTNTEAEGLAEAVSEPFKREECYIVIKRKHLQSITEASLLAGLEQLGVSPVECVVVESDWPEYETVWKMIEARCTRTPTEAEGLAERIAANASELMLRRVDPQSECYRTARWAVGQTLAALSSPPEVEVMDGGRPLPIERDELGRMVREAWVRWAEAQPNPKPSWLVPYADLAEPDKEADRQIGEAIARWTLIADAARAALTALKGTAS